MEANSLSITQQATYYTTGMQNNKLVYVLHGYGQLAKFFIRKFDPLVEKGYAVVAPEGLHRFYLSGNSGRVGASWMTKEKRELDIANYLQFLNQLHQHLALLKAWDEVIVLGFSQGVATAFRWVANGLVQPSKLLLCSGMIPPDVDLEEQSDIFNRIEMTYFTGLRDEYRTEEAVVSFQARLRSMPQTIKMITFDGTHEVNLPSILKFL